VAPEEQETAQEAKPRGNATRPLKSKTMNPQQLLKLNKRKTVIRQLTKKTLSKSSSRGTAKDAKTAAVPTPITTADEEVQDLEELFKVPTQASDLVYGSSRYMKHQSPNTIYVPSARLFFDVMRICCLKNAIK